jgi:hypothetical protein
MKIAVSTAAMAFCLFAAAGANAQDQRAVGIQPVQPLSERPSAIVTDPSAEPDVLLDIPNLSVEEITLEVDNLQARLNVEARLANLLHLNAGADVSVDKVKITIKGVNAQVLLKVRLDNVAAIIDRTLTTIDRNPEILERLLTSVDNTVDTVGGVANTTLQPGGVVDNTVGTVGQVAGQAIPPRN